MSGPGFNSENELSSTLQRKADEFARRGGHDLDLSQVMSRAGEIRRGRRMRASMVMAAVVVAIAVPVGITVLDNDPARQNDNPSIATNSADPTPTPTPTPTETPTKVDDSRLTLGDLPTGDAPRIPYVVDGELLGGPNGPIEAFKDQYVQAFAQVTGGFMVQNQDSKGNLIASFVSNDGAVNAQSWPISSGFAVSPDGNVAAFAQEDGTVIAVQDSGSRSFELSKVPGGYVDVIAVVGESCSGRSEADACEVIASTKGNDPRPWQTQRYGAATQLEGPYDGYQRLAGVNQDGLIAGYVSIDDLKPGSCSEVRNAEGARSFKTCDYSFDGFSPDGSKILATTPYRDGLGNPNVAVLSIHGKVLLDLPGAIYASTWEDDSHLLVTVMDPTTSRAAVVRVSLDGSREYALAPRTSKAEGNYDGGYQVATVGATSR